MKIRQEKKVYKEFQYKDVQLKTIYMEYVQRRYINADMHFPERCSSCIAQEMVNTNANAKPKVKRIVFLMPNIKIS